MALIILVKLQNLHSVDARSKMHPLQRKSPIGVRMKPLCDKLRLNQVCQILGLRGGTQWGQSWQRGVNFLQYAQWGKKSSQVGRIHVANYA